MTTMVENREISQGRLYLSKGDGQDIYIDNCQLTQHQIDGIRFLYRQMKKKNPGVILNDPPETTLLTVLFLNAMQHVLDKPILILCNNGEQRWMNKLCRWAKFKDDVVIEPSNPFMKKMSVCINPMENLASFSRRDWSVIIVESDCTTKDILQSNFSSDLKIWIISANLKDDLRTFSLIYNWFYPKKKFSAIDYEPSANNTKDVITKAIQLDTFMKDIVYKSKNQKPNKKVAPLPITSPKVTKKNKDATGTKIKRTKRNLNTNIDLNVAVKIPKKDRILKAESDKAITTDDEKNNIINEEQEKMDVETFIRDQDPIGPEDYRVYLIDSVLSTSQNSHQSRKSLDIELKNVKYSTYTEANSTVSNHKYESKVNDKFTTQSKNELFIKADSQDAILENVDVELTNGNKNGNLKTNPTDVDNDNSQSTDFVLHYDDTDNKTANIVKAESNEELRKSGSNVNDIEFKIIELEEMTLKMFKGSFLDSLF